MTDTQYFIDVEKGFTVIYGNKPYRVQDDGRGYLHIIVFEDGKRKKLGIDKLASKRFEPGSHLDWIFNNWYQIYTWPEFQSFAKAEIAWIKQTL